MRKVVLIRKASHNIGGIEGQVLRFACEVRRRRLLDPSVLTSALDSALADECNRLGIPVMCQSMDWPKLCIPSVQVRSFISDHNPLLQSHGFRESFVGRILKMEQPRLHHIYRVHTYIRGCTSSSLRRMCYYSLDRLSNKYVDRYVANSLAISDELVHCARVNSQRVRIVMNGRAPIGDPDGPTCRPGDSLPERVAIVANFVPGKGHDILIRALRILRDSGLRVQARFIGDDMEASCPGAASTSMILKDLARAAGVETQIEWFGYTRDVHSALTDYAVVVLPSGSEGVPNCIIEAMSLRKLVVASRVGGIPEMISHGENGLLHEPGSPGALAATLKAIFSAPSSRWEPIRTAAYEVWCKRFSMDKMISGFLTTYDEI